MTMAASVAALLDDAFAAYQADRLEEAEALYRAALAIEAEHPDALHRLGMVLFRRGLAQAGAASVKRALALVPAAVVLFEHLAIIVKTSGQIELTLALARRGLALAPAPGLFALAGQAYVTLGRLNEALSAFTALAARGSKTAPLDVAFCLRRLGRPEEARTLYRELASGQDDPRAVAALAEMAAETGEFAGALRHWRQALALAPADPVFRFGIGRSHMALKLYAEGERDFCRTLALTAFAQTPELVLAALMELSSALHRTGNVPAAAKALRRLGGLVPAEAGIWCNLGLLASDGSDERRRIVAERALALTRTDPRAWNLHGVALASLLMDRPAQASLRRAIVLEPANPDFLGNYDEFLHSPSIDWAKRASLTGSADGESAIAFAMALARVQRLDEARTILQSVLEKSPNHRRVHLALACITLALGDLDNGWRLYAGRFHLAGVQPPRIFPQPLWLGEPLSGSLLVWPEQGIGDEILLATLLPDLLERKVAVVLECDRRLISIYERSFPGIEVIAYSDPPDQRLLRSDIVAQASLSHLAGLLRSSLQSFPSRTTTLVAEPDRLAQARKWLEGIGPGLKVGIAWRSKSRSRLVARIHTELLEWGPILSTPGVVPVRLQYDECSLEMAEAERTFGVRIHSMPGLDLFNDLEGTLALSAALDLAVCTGTSAYAFPAAAGVETWLLRPRDDYLALGQEHYPWFPNTRGFVREVGEDWQRVMEEVAAELRERTIKKLGA
jgi:tetratricopeptide (TPR) repeat protein